MASVTPFFVESQKMKFRTSTARPVRLSLYGKRRRRSNLSAAGKPCLPAMFGADFFVLRARDLFGNVPPQMARAEARATQPLNRHPGRLLPCNFFTAPGLESIVGISVAERFAPAPRQHLQGEDMTSKRIRLSAATRRR